MAPQRFYPLSDGRIFLGIGKCNAIGTLLLGLCPEFNLSIMNTLFRQKTKDKKTWMHPRSKHWHMINYIIVRNRDRAACLRTKAMRRADDGWTDHHLLV